MMKRGAALEKLNAIYPAIWSHIQNVAALASIFNLVFGDFSHDLLKVVHQSVQEHGRPLVHVNQLQQVMDIHEYLRSNTVIPSHV